MPRQWDDTSDRQLLLIIISLTAPAPPKWDQVAEMMGDGYTAEAVRQHYQKIRKTTEQTLGGFSLGNKAKGRKADNEETPKTPRSKGRAKGKQITVQPDLPDNEDEEYKEAPEKKIKLES